jgi:hypothetical protein
MRNIACFFAILAFASTGVSAQDLTQSIGVGGSLAIGYALGYTPLPGLASELDYDFSYDFSDTFALSLGVALSWQGRTAMAGEGYYYRGFYEFAGLIQGRITLPFSFFDLPLSIDVGGGGAVGLYEHSSLLFFYPLVRLDPNVLVRLGESAALRLSAPFDLRFQYDLFRCNIGLLCAYEWK